MPSNGHSMIKINSYLSTKMPFFIWVLKGVLYRLLVLTDRPDFIQDVIID